MPLFSIKKRLKRFTNFVTKKSSSSKSNDFNSDGNCFGDTVSTAASTTVTNNIKNDLKYPDRDEKNSYRDYSKNRELLGVCNKKTDGGKNCVNEDKLCNVSVSKNVRPKENVSMSIAEAERSEFFCKTILEH